MRRLIILCVSAFAAWIGCESDDKRPAVLKPTNTFVDASTGRGDSSITAGAAGQTGAAGAAGSLPGGSGGAPTGMPENCGEVTCRGPGGCELVGGIATCVCDQGYALNDEDECVIDESCVKFRFLENRCRVTFGGPPAVGLFFAVDFCAGTAVLPDKLAEIAPSGFRIIEDGRDIVENPESSATVIERDVESYVTLAIDVSGSVTADPTLIDQLATELRAFVAGLTAPAGEPPVGVSVLLFGLDVAEYVPFTTDLNAVDDALAELQSDPDGVLERLSVRRMGTVLHDAVNTGIRHTERILHLREIVTDGGVLSTGTLVVVTDGRDTGGADLEMSLIEETVVSLISIGISSDIDDDDLTLIGRDASFLAPEPEDWADAFDKIVRRVEEYPDRSYLLAYCSSANAETHEVRIELNEDALSQTTAHCEFNADVFGVDFDDVCDVEYLTDPCAGLECGGLSACGACADDACCFGGTCNEPSPSEDCNDNHAMCQPGGGQCVQQSTDPEPVYECVPYAQIGEECDSSSNLCEPGVAFCNDDELCEAVTLAQGDICGDQDEHPKEICPELNCTARNPRQPAQGHVCRREARMFEPCSGQIAEAACEAGAFCFGTECDPQSVFGCDSDAECAFGKCGKGSNVCLREVTGACHFDWHSKMAGL